MAAVRMRRWTSTTSTFIRDSRAAEVIEMALVLPILLIVVAGIVDMGFLFNNYETLTNAAREGARMAAVPGWVQSDVETRVKNYLQAVGMNPDAVTMDIQPVEIDVPGGTMNGVRVVVTYPYNYVILGPIAQLVQGGATFDTVNLTAVATMRSEIAAGL